MEPIKKTKQNLYNEWSMDYINKGFSAIPDKFMMKQPAIKGWSDYCHKLPSRTEVQSWCSNFDETNIAIALGEASGIIALDVDTDDPKILDIILPVLPSSPVEKKGAKGFTRFFRYNGEHTEIIKHNGECILEVLSTNKKTTIPPSIHPNGIAYKWVDKSLLDIRREELPVLPPFLVAHISNKLQLCIPDTEVLGHGKTISGRNNILSAFCGELIRDGVPVDEAIKKLIEKDESENVPPLFTDSNEFGHTETFTNALGFYSNHLGTVNNRHFKKNEEYEIPITASSIDKEQVQKILEGKSLREANKRKLNILESPTALAVKRTCPCCGKVKR